MLRSLRRIASPVWWSLPYRGTRGYIWRSFTYDLTRCADNAQIEFVWHLPLWAISWAVVRGAVILEPNEYPGDVKAQEILKHIEGIRKNG